MDALTSPVTSPALGTFSGLTSRSRSNTRLDDITSLTSFNPFAEEDEHDQSSYTLTSIFSRVKNTLAPLSTHVISNSAPPPNAPNTAEQKRPPNITQPSQSSISTRLSETLRERPTTLSRMTTITAAPPLVSLTPVQSEAPSFHMEYDRPPSRSGLYQSNMYDLPDGGNFGTSIPGFPIPDDARSIKTSTSLHRSASVSKVMRRIRGEGLSKDYWMDDENAKECYDCKSVFTTWRRRHHCRICGQIFCSRCASNIISASRFGRDGMVRVCNLCLEKLDSGEDDEDDRRSVNSSAISFANHQFGGGDGIGLAHHPQSPFAASQLFERTHEPFNLYSIAETRRLRSNSEGDMSPMDTILREGADGMWEPVKDYPAPFRRSLAEDDKDSVTLPDTFDDDGSPIPPGAKPSYEFPTIQPHENDQTSYVQFPTGSPERALDSPRSQSQVYNNRYDSHDVPTPFIRSRVQSRLDALSAGEPGWRTRRESTAYAHELNLTSMHHLKVMLRQLLMREQIPNFREWEETLSRLALKIARELTFTAHRQGEDMDVRRYVKIKKIPGGTPQDSEYVDGAVITKNVAHKYMSRSQRNPRIMLVTFPVEFHRVEGVYMHFGQIFRQEKEYLGNLASRIAALRPHIVLVEKSVSRLALDALAQYNVAVARGVKPSTIQALARMTAGDIFSSIDKLAQEPRLGHCGQYRIQTFDHPLIPGRRKTYMRFEGCPPELGCTVLLRGGDLETLKKIKRVTRFLIFIVRNLKLETHLWKDSVITLPAFNDEATPCPSTSDLPISPSNVVPPSFPPLYSTLTTDEESNEDIPDEDAEQLRLTQRINESIEPYKHTFISVSATLRFPPPFPLLRMKELDDELILAKRQWEDEVIRREESVHRSRMSRASVVATPVPVVSSQLPIQSPDLDDINAQIEALQVNLSSSEGDGDYFSEKHDPLQLNDSNVKPSFALKTIADIASETRVHQAKFKHEAQKRVWEWYLRKNPDDFVVEKYQCISLVQYTIPVAQYGRRRACFAPQLKYVTFYGENDCTLGQYIENAVAQTLRDFLDPSAICTGKGCDEARARHCKVYIHNETKLFVAVEQWDGQIRGELHSPNLVTTWSACRLCGMATPFIPVSQEMLRYSFAKFLELHFYPADVKIVLGAGCQHNIYQHHIRYFALQGMTVRFQADPIILHEIVYPPMRIRVRPDIQLELKNVDYEHLVSRNTLWYGALVDDLKLISIDAATGDEESDAKLLMSVNSLINRAEKEREEINQLINRIYSESEPTDTLALNQVHSFRQDKIVAWQQDFDRLPKPKPLTINEKSSRRTSAFRTIWQRKPGYLGTMDSQVPSSNASEAEDRAPRRRPTGGSFTSSASEASESEAGNEFNEKISPPLPATTKEATIEPSATQEQETEVKKEDSPSDADSDSTIGAVKDSLGVSPPGRTETPPPVLQQQSQVTSSPEVELPRSRLPRPVHKPSVAELVKRYQDYLPPQGVHELARTALHPQTFNQNGAVSESEAEYPPPSTFIQPRHTVRTKTRQHVPVKKPSISDFESSYAANVAPRYISHTHHRRHNPHRGRLPGPKLPGESRASSRRPSPDKLSTNDHPRTRRAVSPSPSVPSSVRGSRVRGHARIATKENSSNKSGPSSSKLMTHRRPPGTPGGSKVSNIAKHFERLGREAERVNRRYAVIRGRRARPVASAKAKVEILESIKDAINDESDESSESSEADDEGGDDDPVVAKPGKETQESAPTEESPEDSRPDLPKLQLQTASPPRTDTLSNVSTVTETPSGYQPQGPHTESMDPPPAPTTSHPGPISLPPSPFLNSFKVNQPLSMTPPPPDMQLTLDQGRHPILKAISGFWLSPSSRIANEMDDPFNDPEHIFRDSSMIVRTDEPTSIIALALNSPQYREMLLKSRVEKRSREAVLVGSGEAFMPDDHSVAESNSTWGVVNVDTIDMADPTADMKVASSKLPWAISFESGGLTISCTILYPEQFDALRRTYDCDKTMIESLARCVKWNASGGKSGSAFLKTRDDRFIAKELSRPELQSMETFAPAYFEYMSSAVSGDRPTLLAKVFGCFKIVFKKTSHDKGANTNKFKSTQMNLLIMENLFYDRRFAKIYDLKGSTRNRHVEATGRENEVLLDDNLIQTAHLAPFYLREHSKRLLRGALYNDSKFLADINVMDYSLLVGVDVQRQELIVGIVDYIRTYTWDKKLENLVKESAFLGTVGKGEPTIVTPKLYRQRFLSAMERYFPLVPDRWMKQKDSPEEDPKTVSELWPDW